jgi:chromate reductase
LTLQTDVAHHERYSARKGNAVNPVPNVVVLIGSLREDSLNRKVANAVIDLNAAPLKFEIAEIGNCPLQAGSRGRESTGGVALLSPENQERRCGSFRYSGIQPLRARRPEKCAGCSFAPLREEHVGRHARRGDQHLAGALGAFGANNALRQSLVFLNVPAMQQPEAYIGGAADLFDADGKLINPSIRDFLSKFVQSFGKWIEANRRG